MLSKEFAFHAPAELDETLALLAESEGIVKVLAGGMSLVPAMNLGLVRPDVVISLNHVPGLDYVEHTGDSVRIGAMVRHHRLVADPLIASSFPLLAEVELPKLPDGAGSAYLRLARVEGSFAIVSAAAVVDGGRPRVAIGGATGAPVLVEPGVDLAGGLSEDALEEIGQAAYTACEDAFGDLNGSAEYRRELARVYARRAVEAA